MPVRLKINERDDAIILVCGNQDQAAITGPPMLLRRIQVPGYPCLQPGRRCSRLNLPLASAAMDVDHGRGSPVPRRAG